MPRLVLSPYLKCQIDKLSESDSADFSSLTGDFSKMPPVPPVNLWPFFLSGWKCCTFSHADVFVRNEWSFWNESSWESDGEPHQMFVRVFLCWQTRWRYSGQGEMAHWDCSPWKPLLIEPKKAAFGKDHLNVKLFTRPVIKQIKTDQRW